MENNTVQVGKKARVGRIDYHVIAYFQPTNAYILNSWQFIYEIDKDQVVKKIGFVEENFKEFELFLKKMPCDLLEISTEDKICDPNSPLKYLVVCDIASTEGNMMDSRNYEEEASVSNFNKKHCRFFPATKAAVGYIAKGKDSNVFLTKIQEKLFFISQKEAWLLKHKTGENLKEYYYDGSETGFTCDDFANSGKIEF